jgi:phosphoribosylformylglycinamidine cyclo-ligase
MDREPLTYAQAGVDVEAGDRAVALMRSAVEATQGPRVLGGIGGFAGLWRLADRDGRWAGQGGDPGGPGPVLAAATDGVGTKLLVAQALDRHDTVGIDLVAGRVDPARVAAIVAGVAEGCRLARCALLGGETAEHPGAMEPGAYDLAGFAVGMVERDRLLGPDRVVPGDVLLGLASSGLHANGFSLARQVLDRAGIGYDRELPGLGVPAGEALLTPTRIYAPHLVDLLATGIEVHALCHITGGGLPGNLPRSVPPGLTARVDRSSWEPPPIFQALADLGPVAEDELARATNLGIGMVAILPAAEADRAAAFLADHDIESWVMGEVAG